MRPRFDRQKLLGQKFSFWTVTTLAPNWREVTCRCACGTIRDVLVTNLLRGSTKSCRTQACVSWKNREGKGSGVQSTINRYVVIPKSQRRDFP